MATGSVLPVVIGVDIGGTNTDVVLIHQENGVPRVLSEVKEHTTCDVTDGLQRAVLRCLLQAKDKGFVVAPIQVNIGTTHFVNAVVEHRDLARVAVLRLTGPSSHELPPFCDFPKSVADLVRGPVHMVRGGYSYDGTQPNELDEEALRQIIAEIKEQGINNIAILGIFSPVRSDQETKTGDIASQVHPEATVTLSHEIGDFGLLERENATILNESLKPLCQQTISKFEKAFNELGISCPFVMTQNNGTVISSSDVLRFPVLTFASGPTNSMRGAAFLTSKREAVVVDIGGTTTDAGILTKGFPREASTHIRVAGIKTNFRMPDVVSIGLGGGSYITENRGLDGALQDVTIGPLSAGYNLKNEALVFSTYDKNTEGRRLTTTDIAVFSGLCNLGYKERVSHLNPDVGTKSLEKIHAMLESVVDGIKLSREDVSVIIVGGGSVIVDPSKAFRGASEIIIPEHFGVANAIGAALSKVSATLSSMVHLPDFNTDETVQNAIDKAVKNMDQESFNKSQVIEETKRPFVKKARDEAIDKCCEDAKIEVIKRGAKQDGLEILEKSDSVLPYIPDGALHIKVKVVGDLDQPISSQDCVKPWTEPRNVACILDGGHTRKVKQKVISSDLNKLSIDETEENADATGHPKYPHIDPKSGEWILSDWDIESIVLGAGIYGCGGGGSLHMARIKALKAWRNGKKFRVVRRERLLRDAHPEKDLIIVPALMGSPSVMFEQGSCSSSSREAVEVLKDVYQIGDFTEGTLRNEDGAKVDHDDTGCRFVSDYKPPKTEKTSGYNAIGVMSVEFAGTNAVEPLLLAAEADLPAVDCDGMSRAFPSFEMYIPFMYGKEPYPVSVVSHNEFPKRTVLLYSPTAKHAENYIRDIAIKNGCVCNLAVALTKSDVLDKTAPLIISSAWRMGNAILRARLQKESVIDVMVKQENGKHIISGKVIDVQKETTGGFNKGKFVVEGSCGFDGEAVEIIFQNEYLVVYPLANGERGAHKGCVPDLITVMDADTAEPIPAEEIRYGMRIAVVLLPSCDLLRTPQALKFVGPQAYRYLDDVTFTPYAERVPIEPIPLL